MLSIFIQDGSETAENLEPLVQEKTLSIMELLMDGGMAGQIIIGVLFVLLFTAVYLYFERLFAIKAATDYDINFMDEIRNNVSSGNLEAAKVLCAKKNTPVSRLTEKGISRIGSPLEDINTAIENAGRLEVYQLEKNISILATISGAAPMLGFLGTVIGMILSIFEISNAGGNIDMQLLADGLYTAMTTTVAGLIVGILGYITYNHLVVKTNKAVYQMEASSLEFLDLLNEPA